jgi:hypothetical protein
LQIYESELSEKFVDELNAVFTKYPGKSSLRMVLIAEDPTHSVQTISNLRVDTNPDFLKELERLISDRYKLN